MQRTAASKQGGPFLAGWCGPNPPAPREEFRDDIDAWTAVVVSCLSLYVLKYSLAVLHLVQLLCGERSETIPARNQRAAVIQPIDWELPQSVL
jgi:hypothetical protein